ncbi:CAP domain-containing protein [Natronocalculus amylovorans]|uniref:CAP domain-containing protein n=1 Tax=Natronocalculus amylovorans TaxID=2917812 RepID=A0AAE3K886_9EURY|nr:CAP domain-containing protein [Natronocalculus amylovorans]MCL9817032.1 CAP domain-containing protein [Natronocalculus amylovorans]NUE02939.1 CAP domain-containing protein [Halorubraceae archaeon YAN]
MDRSGPPIYTLSHQVHTIRQLRSIIGTLISITLRLVVVVAVSLAIVLAAGGFDTTQLPAVELDTESNPLAPATERPADQPDTQPQPTVSEVSESRIEQEIHDVVNREREAEGVDPVTFDTDLREIARYHSTRMATEDFFAHTAPDGETLGDRYQRFGYRCQVSSDDGWYRTGGENLAQTWYDQPIATDDGTVVHESESDIAEGVVTQWLNSPGHRDNMLDEHWEGQGIGVVAIETDDGIKIFATQNFC